MADKKGREFIEKNEKKKEKKKECFKPESTLDGQKARKILPLHPVMPPTEDTSFPPPESSHEWGCKMRICGQFTVPCGEGRISGNRACMWFSGAGNPRMSLYTTLNTVRWPVASSGICTQPMEGSCFCSPLLPSTTPSAYTQLSSLGHFCPTVFFAHVIWLAEFS